MAKLVEYITPTWIPEKEGECIPIYDPAIDGKRIELVRCKNCEYWKNHDYTQRWTPCMSVLTDGDWFCGSGRRKEK